MEGQLQTSFIPKRPLVQKVGGGQGKKTNVFVIVMVTILLTVIALGVGLYFYDSYLKKHNQDLQNQLNAAVAQLQPQLISDLNRLNTRIESTKTVLNQHIALSSFFDFLGKVTLPDIRFSSFSYSYSGQKIDIAMGGEAKSFSAIAIQAETLAKPDYAHYIQNPTFSGFALDKSGNVTFDFKASLDPATYLYSKKLAGMVVTTNPNTPVTQTVTIATTSVATTTATTTKTNSSSAKVTPAKTH